MDESRKNKIEFAKNLIINSYNIVDKKYVMNQVIGVDFDYFWKQEQRRRKIEKIKENIK